MILRRPAHRHREARAQGLANARAKPGDPAVRVERELAGRLAATAVIGREQIFRARRHPLDRPTEPARQPRDQHLFSIRAAFHAEPAADVGGDHANPRLVETEHARERRADPERRLRRRPHGELAGVRVPAGERAARLHRHAAQALLLDGQAHPVSRVAERAVGIAVAPRHGERAVVTAHGNYLRRPGCQGAVGIRDAVERLVLDRESIHAVRRRVGRLGNDRRHGNALGADDTGRQQRVLGHERAGSKAHERNRPDRAEILGGDDRDDTRRSLRGAGVEGSNPRVSVRATRQEQVQRAGGREVVDEPPATGQERPVLPAQHRSSDPAGWLWRVRHVDWPFGR